MRRATLISRQRCECQHGGDEIIRIQGLFHVDLEPGRKRVMTVFRSAGRRNGRGRQRGERRIGPQPQFTDQRETILVGKTQIRQQDVCVMSFQRPQGVRGGTDRNDMGPVELERLGKHLPRVLIVFDEKD